MNPYVKKFLELLVSRKVWIHIIGLAVALGLVHATGTQEAAYVDGALTIGAVASTGISIAIEDGLKALANAVAKALLEYAISGKVELK